MQSARFVENKLEKIIEFENAHIQTQINTTTDTSSIPGNNQEHQQRLLGQNLFSFPIAALRANHESSQTGY